jgi:glycosyltransferase involved in cell wall biosynthesis
MLQVGTHWDFIMAAGARAPCGLSRSELLNKILWFREASLAKTAAQFAKHATILVSASCIAKAAFTAAREAGTLTVLNFQTVHHRYVRRLLVEEIELQPEFAVSLMPYLYSSAIYDILDDEISLADHILVGSSFAKLSFTAEGIPASKTTIIPYGTNLSMFTPAVAKPNRSGLKILFVGQISQLKGISYALEAYRKTKGPSTHLTLVGNFIGSSEPFRKYQSDFTHISHVPHDVMPQIFRNADVFVLPTLADGMGLAVLEAMASGLPVIVTANGPGDLVRDGIDGFVVPIRDSEAIAVRLDVLRNNPEMRLAMGQSARLRAEQFSWEMYALTAADLVLSLAPSGREEVFAQRDH